MVFVPLTAPAALGLRAGDPTAPLPGFAVTPALRRALGADSTEDEADFAALSTAGVAALAGLLGEDGSVATRRLVLAAEATAEQVVDLGTDLGEVRLGGLRWSQVQAVFADEDEAADQVAAAAREARGVALPDLLGLPATVALGETHDLLWYDPSELDALV